MLGKAISCTLVAMGLAEITWNPSQTLTERRLKLETTTSHTKQSLPDCIVGGFDSENPAKIYIGGPCSELSDKKEPSAKFKWIEMESVHMDIVDPTCTKDCEPAPFKYVAD
jgi:hypothetical protein